MTLGITTIIRQSRKVTQERSYNLSIPIPKVPIAPTGGLRSGIQSVVEEERIGHRHDLSEDNFSPNSVYFNPLDVLREIFWSNIRPKQIVATFFFDLLEIERALKIVPGDLPKNLSPTPDLRDSELETPLAVLEMFRAIER